MLNMREQLVGKAWAPACSINISEQLADKDGQGAGGMLREQLLNKDDAGMLNVCEQLADKDDAGMLNVCEQLADKGEASLLRKPQPQTHRRDRGNAIKLSSSHC